MSEPTPHVLGELSRYLDGKLSGAVRRRIEAHLESCEACRKHHEGLLSMRNLLQQTPSLMPQSSFVQALIPSLRTLKILFLIAVAAAVLWAVRRQHKVDLVMPEKKPPVKAAPVAPTPVKDPGLQDLQDLTQSLPSATTAAVAEPVPETPPAIVPETPEIPEPPVVPETTPVTQN